MLKIFFSSIYVYTYLKFKVVHWLTLKGNIVCSRGHKMYTKCRNDILNLSSLVQKRIPKYYKTRYLSTLHSTFNGSYTIAVWQTSLQYIYYTHGQLEAHKWMYNNQKKAFGFRTQEFVVIHPADDFEYFQL